MGSRSSIVPVIALVACLWGYQWYTAPADGNAMCIQYGQELGAMWSEAAERIRIEDDKDPLKIKSEPDLFKFADAAAEQSRKDIFSANLEPRFDAVQEANKGAWNAKEYAALCDKLAKEFGE